MRAAILLLIAAPLFAQLQASFYDGSNERTLAGVTDLGAASMGDVTEYRFHARNNTSASIALQSLALTGQSFLISDKPSLPYIVAPQNFVEFRLRFAPTATGAYSATLAVNGATYLLTASAVGAPTLTLASSPSNPLAAGATIDFGSVQRNRTTTVGLRLSNTTKTALTAQSIVVRGDAFAGPQGITLPATLAAGAAVTFQLTFTPAAAGAQTGLLLVDGRSFNLLGTGFDAPLPQPSVVISGATTSASQPALSLKFASVPESSGTGTLTMDFAPSTAIAGDDPTILFPTTGSRRLSFTVTEGDATASFDKQKSVPFQTGTTAGVITFTAAVGAYTVHNTVTVAPAAVAINSANALRRVSNIDVTVTAFDNTRTAGRFNFIFYDLSGKQISPGLVPVDSTADFGRYFAISRVGGSFLMRATFPVTGDISQIGGVDVELINSSGSARTSRLTLQ